MDNKWTPISIAFLSVSILVSSLYVGNSMKTENQSNPVTANVNLSTNKSADILTVIEAASYLKLSTPIVYGLVESSKYDELGIPYYKVNGEIRFSKKALGEWLIKIANYKDEF